MRQIEDGWARIRECRRKRGDRLTGDPHAYLTRFVVAVQDGIDHVVDGAGADRVVGAVADHLSPGEVQQLRGVRARGQEQCSEWLGTVLDLAFRQNVRTLDVDAVRRDTHQHVGPIARSQLAHPSFKVVVGHSREVIGERGDREDQVVLGGVGLGDGSPQERLWVEMI